MAAERPFPWNVTWTRGDGCKDLAELLARGEAVQADPDPVSAAVKSRADLAVMKRIGSFDLLPVAAPSHVDPGMVSQVVAAVAEGPHSLLAARIAGRVGEVLDVPGVVMSVVQPGHPRAPARKLVEKMRAGSGLDGTVLEAESAARLIDAMDRRALLVLGAPGGSWLHRQFLGPGARLVAHAPAGTIVVRDAPRRAFRDMAEPSAVGVHMRASDAAAVVTHPVSAVVDDGALVGLVRRARLLDAPTGAAVGDVMETPVFVDAADALVDVLPIADFFEGAPIPLIDRNGMLVGSLDPDAVAIAAD